MLDVIHYIFEEDSVYISKEHLETREVFRKRMFQEMYGRPYNYFRGSSSSDGSSYLNDSEQTSQNDFDDMSPVDPLKPPTKGYVPPTDFNPNSPKPFGSVLDAPLG